MPTFGSFYPPLIKDLKHIGSETASLAFYREVVLYFIGSFCLRLLFRISVDCYKRTECPNTNIHDVLMLLIVV